MRHAQQPPQAMAAPIARHRPRGAGTQGQGKNQDRGYERAAAKN